MRLKVDLIWDGYVSGYHNVVSNFHREHGTGHSDPKDSEFERHQSAGAAGRAAWAAEALIPRFAGNPARLIL